MHLPVPSGFRSITTFVNRSDEVIRLNVQYGGKSGYREVTLYPKERLLANYGTEYRETLTRS